MTQLFKCKCGTEKSPKWNFIDGPFMVELGGLVCPTCGKSSMFASDHNQAINSWNQLNQPDFDKQIKDIEDAEPGTQSV